MWLAGAAPSGGALREAHIQITVRGDTASVIAWYRFAGTRDSLRFRATRPAGQTMIFQGVAGAAGLRAARRAVRRHRSRAPRCD